MFLRSHSPPPSATGRMWSASHRLLRVRLRSPQCCNSSCRAEPRACRSLRAAATASTPHEEQIPRSRRRTCSRRYPGCDRSFHSCTQYSEQNVYRPRGTSSEHHRHRPRPLGPRGIAFRSTQPPIMMRVVLTFRLYNVRRALHISFRDAPFAWEQFMAACPDPFASEQNERWALFGQ